MNSQNNYIPEQAIIVYKSPTDVYLESRQYVMKEDKKYHMKEGVPFSLKDYQNLAKGIKEDVKEDPITSGRILNNKVLHFNFDKTDKKLIWFCRGHVRELRFDKQSKIKNGKYWVSHLLFMVKNNHLYVYALKKVNVNEDTILYKAPFPNVYSDNNICEGNVKIKKDQNNINNIIIEWEKFFFDSEFTHFNELNISEANLERNYNKIVDKAIQFPSKILKKTDLTLKNLIDGE